jgi:hypothetical protein
MGESEQRRILRGIALFLVPIVGALVPLILVDVLVPRSESQAVQLTQKIAITTTTLMAEVGAAFYYVAVSAAITIIICAATIWCCCDWLFKSGLKEATARERGWIWLGITLAVAFPIGLLFFQILFSDGCSKFAIDDCVTKALFTNTIHKLYPRPQFFAMNQDANFMACLVFMSYLIAVVTNSTAAASAYPVKAHARDRNKRAVDVSERANILNLVLFLIAGVLVAAMVTAKFRFDVGLATLGPPPTPKAPNAAYQAYQTLASAIMAYWASVLSICLALIYLPSAYVLNRKTTDSSERGLTSFFSLNRENGLRLLKAAAIVSPPIINKLIEIFAALPKSA